MHYDAVQSAAFKQSLLYITSPDLPMQTHLQSTFHTCTYEQPTDCVDQSTTECKMLFV